MSGLAHLRHLAQGRRPADDGLLGNTRCAWGGSELLSEESILAAFSAQPFEVDDTLLEVETEQSAVLVGLGRALVADLYGGRIARLWRVGTVLELTPEPAIDVAFDPDLRQERGSLGFRREDHPTLHAAAVGPLLAVAHDLIPRIASEGRLRVRGFVVRAFGDASSGAALLSLYTLSDTTSRSAASGYAVVATGPAGPRVVSDRLPPRAWTPRF